MHDMRINFSTGDALERGSPGAGPQCGAAADGSRRVEPGPGRGAGVVLLPLVAVG